MPTLGGNTINLVAGPYTMQYTPSSTASGQALGQTATGLVELDSRSISFTSWYGTPVKCDLYGETEIEGIYRGRDCFLTMTLIEWSPIVRAMLNPFGPTTQDLTTLGAVGTVGRTVTDLAGTIVLTAVSGTLAAGSNGPATITAAKAILAKGQDINLLLSCDYRKIPVKFQLYPYDQSNKPVFFTTS